MSKDPRERVLTFYQLYLKTLHWSCCATLILTLVGCHDGADLRNIDYNEFRARSMMYGLYLGAHNQQPPPTEQALRDFLMTKQENLERAGISVEDMFISPRNGETIQWVFGHPLPKSPNGMMTYIGYEQVPVEGRRLVLATRGMYEEVDDTQLKNIFPDAP